MSDESIPQTDKAFTLEIGNWNLDVSISSVEPERIELGLRWNDKDYYSHSCFVKKSKFLEILRDIGVLDAEVIPERSDTRDASDESTSLGEGVRTESDRSEEPSSSGGTYIGLRRSDREDRDPNSSLTTGKR